VPRKRTADGVASSTMISVKVSPAGRPLSLARGLPVTVGVKEDAKVSDVKAAIASKFPKVGRVLRGMDDG
jgi:hypothetical protein